MQIEVFCADIGSVQAGKFGWAGRTAEALLLGDDIASLCVSVAGLVNNGHKVALGFECPLFVPIRTEPGSLLKARAGEGSRPWSASAGSQALTMGLVQVSFILEQIKALLNVPTKAFVDWPEFADSLNGIFLWEAFVSGKAKYAGTEFPHSQDGLIAVDAFVRSLPNPDAFSAVKEEHVMSLLGAALLRTGWTTDLALLRQSVLVIRG